LKLQTSYGQALIWAKGFGADETKAAFIRANELIAGVGDATERFPTYYGLWVSSMVQGEFGFARRFVESFLQEAKWTPTKAAFLCWIQDRPEDHTTAGGPAEMPRLG